nr:ribonuclease H-like domain-containing protein [Tanacetum cinerariifolium]
NITSSPPSPPRRRSDGDVANRKESGGDVANGKDDKRSFTNLMMHMCGAFVLDKCQIIQTKVNRRMSDKVVDKRELHTSNVSDFSCNPRKDFGSPLVFLVLTSVEDEYRSIAATCEIMWIVKIMSDLNIRNLLPAELYCDNKAAMQIVANPVMHEKTKHFDLDVHFIREKVCSGLIKAVKNITSSPPSLPRRRSDGDVANRKESGGDVANGKDNKRAFTNLMTHMCWKKPTRSRAATLACGVKTRLTTSLAKVLASVKDVYATNLIIFILTLKIMQMKVNRRMSNKVVDKNELRGYSIDTVEDLLFIHGGHTSNVSDFSSNPREDFGSPLVFLVLTYVGQEAKFSTFYCEGDDDFASWRTVPFNVRRKQISILTSVHGLYGVRKKDEWRIELWKMNGDGKHWTNVATYWAKTRKPLSPKTGKPLSLQPVHVMCNGN